MAEHFQRLQLSRTFQCISFPVKNTIMTIDSTNISNGTFEILNKELTLNTEINELGKWFGIIIIFLVIVINGPLLYHIKNSETTLINKLIGFDCFINFCNIPGYLKHIKILPLGHYTCILYLIYTMFVNLLNRLIPVGIVFYRYVYVCKHVWVVTKGQRQTLNMTILCLIIFLSTLGSISTVFYREEYKHYLDCMGRGYLFFYDSDNFLRDQFEGVFFLLPSYHPFCVLLLSIFFSYIILVPIGYIVIFLFVKKQTSGIAGLSKQNLNNRKRRNLVSTRYNLFNWLVECSAPLLLFFSIGEFDHLLLMVYGFVVNCISPIFYFIGIESNRVAMKNHVKAILLELSGKGMPNDQA